MKGFADTPAYVNQPTGTTPEALNVVLLDPATERFRPAQRPGVGVFDLFNFHTGQTESFSTVTIPADGKPAEDGVAVNIPIRGCYAITTDNPLIDVTATGNCDGSTIQIGGMPNGGGSYDGGITITPPGGPSSHIPVHHDGGSTFNPPPNPNRPFLAVKNCSDNQFAFWIHQDVLSFYNALPALKAANGACYYVTGQRTADPNTTADIADFSVVPNCDACTGTVKTCFYPFTQTFNCETGMWGAVQYTSTQCLPPASVTPNTWVFDGGVSTSVRTYNYYAQGGTCSTSATCTTIPTAPTAQGAIPNECAGPVCDPACCEIYYIAWFNQQAAPSGTVLVLDAGTGLYYAGTGAGVTYNWQVVHCEDIQTANGAFFYDMSLFGGASTGSITSASGCPPRGKSGWSEHGAIILVDAICTADVTASEDLPDVLTVVDLTGTCAIELADDATKPIWTGTLVKTGIDTYEANPLGDHYVRVPKLGGGYAAAPISLIKIGQAPVLMFNSQQCYIGVQGQSFDSTLAYTGAGPGNNSRKMPLTIRIEA